MLSCLALILVYVLDTHLISLGGVGGGGWIWLDLVKDKSAFWEVHSTFTFYFHPQVWNFGKIQIVWDLAALEKIMKTTGHHHLCCHYSTMFMNLFWTFGDWLDFDDDDTYMSPSSLPPSTYGVCETWYPGMFLVESYAFPMSWLTSHDDFVVLWLQNELFFSARRQSMLSQYRWSRELHGHYMSLGESSNFCHLGRHAPSLGFSTSNHN